MEHSKPLDGIENHISIKGLILPMGYILIMSLGIYLLFSGWAYDDPFITYRYAFNLAHGIGFVYNQGERVLSTTTPLFALGLAPFSYLGDQLPRFAVLVGAISLALSGVLIWDLGRVWKAPWVGWAGLILYPTFPLLVMTLGSETPLYLAICLGTFVAYVHRRYTLAGLLAVLAILTRPDGAILAAILVGDFLLGRREKIPWKAIAIFAGILIAWIGFAWIYFGSPLPVTLAAKQHQGSMAISQRFAAGFLTVAGWYTSWPYLLAAISATAGVILAIWKKREWLLFLAWPVAYFLAYSILGVSRYFWYYAPLLPGFIVCIGLGITWIPNLFARSVTPPTRIKSRLVPVMSGIMLGIFLFGQVRSLLAMYRNPDRRTTMYQAIGEWLESNTETWDRIGALEVGIIGFFAKRPMVDFAGLIQPQVADQLQKQTTYEDAALWALGKFHPKYLVLQKGVFPKLEMGLVAQSCEIKKIFPGEEFNYPQDLIVYVCDY